MRRRHRITMLQAAASIAVVVTKALLFIAVVCWCAVPASAQRTIELPLQDNDLLWLVDLTDDNRQLVAASSHDVMIYDLQQDALVGRRAIGPDILPAKALVAERRWIVAVRDAAMASEHVKPETPWMQIYPLSAVSADAQPNDVRNIEFVDLLPKDERPLKSVSYVAIVDIDKDHFAVELRLVNEARRRSQEKRHDVVAIVSLSKAKVIATHERLNKTVLLGRQGQWLTGIDFVKREESLRRPLTRARQVRYSLEAIVNPQNADRSVETGPIHSFPGLMYHLIYSPTSDLVFFSRPRLGVPFLGDVTTGRVALLPDLAANLDEYCGSFSPDGSLLAVMGTQRTGTRAGVHPYRWIAIYDARRTTRITTFPLDGRFHHDIPRISRDNRLLVVRILQPGRAPSSAGGWLMGTAPVGFRIWELPSDGTESSVQSMSDYSKPWSEVTPHSAR